MKSSTPFAISIGGAVVVLLALVGIPTRPEVTPSLSKYNVPSRPAASQDLAVGPDDYAIHERQLERAISLPWGRDPFFPIAVPIEDEPVEDEPGPAPPQQRPESRLTGVSLMDGNHLAIIDREIMREGDELPSGYVVTRIDKTTVTVRRGEHEVTLTLGDNR